MFGLFEKYSWISWAITFLIAAFIFYISSISFEPGSFGFGLKPIIYHMGIFFLLAIFLMISLVRGKNGGLIALAIILAGGYAFSDELHQYFVPGRDASLFDIFLDGVGILFATLIYWIRIGLKNLKEL